MPYPIQLECYPCFLKQALFVARKYTDDQKIVKNILLEIMDYLKEIDSTKSPPEVAEFIYEKTEKYVGVADPFEAEKKKYNDIVLDLYPRLKQTVAEADIPLLKAALISIAGNVIDFGANQKEFEIEKTIADTASKKPAIDDNLSLLKDLREAKHILYLGDNTGEIVLDRIFIEEILKENKNAEIAFVVRGGPIINDVTRKDASEVGLDKICKIMDSGQAIPGIILSRVSPEVRRAYDQADVIVSKGQGNLEALIDAPGNIYFLLMVKCDCIARALNVNIGDKIIYRGTGTVLS
jgi:uncharacterized protein with ATP-grasp and redox domains